jgi:PAS domain S-box-containing protein
MISSKPSSLVRPSSRTSPVRKSSGWEITMVLNDEFRAESINADDPKIRGLETDKWLGAWVDDIFCSEEGDTFVSSAIVSNLDLQTFDLNVCIKSHPELKSCARLKKLNNGRTHSFLLNCFFWDANTHHPYTRRDSFEQLGEVTELCFCDLDFDKSQFKISPSLWLLLGYSLSSEHPGFESFKKLIHPDDQEFYTIKALSEPESSFEKNYNFRMEMRLMHSEGVYRWVEAFGIKYFGRGPDNGRIFGIFQDITIRKLVEENFRESESRFNLLLNSRSIGFFDFDHPRKKGYISPILKRMLGYGVKELEDTFEQLDSLIHKDDVQNPRVDFEKGLKDARETYVRECRLRCNDGNFLWVQINGVLFREPDGEIVRRTGFLTNIEKKKAAEIGLAEEQERLRVTLSSIKDAVIATNNDGNVVIFNQTAEAWFNVKAEDVMGNPIPRKLFIVNPKTRAPFPLDENLDVGDGPTDDFKFKGVIKGPDGNEVILSRSYAPLKDTDGEVIGTVLIYHDITSSERYAHEMIKSSKMESIGMLAGGIAHDFNNLLTTILGNISLVQNRFAEIDVLEQSEQACLMAKDLTQQLLTFAKGGAPIKKVVDLRELVTRSVKLSLTGSNVEARFTFAEEDLFVEADPSQMNQVVQNLSINAVQAMPDGGSYDVSLLEVKLESDSPLPLSPGKYICLDLQDSGLGVPEENISKIFDPFFTTKSFGTGLGLTTSYSIVKRHFGHIVVKSDLGYGTRFSIYIPATDKTVEKEVEQEAKIMTGNGKVLLMDDDSSIREVAKLILERLGYTVTGTTRGEDAIAVYKEAMGTERQFDVVIMDLTIPGHMGGKEAIKELLKIDPDVRGVVSSGYSTDPIMSDYKSHGFKGVVEKPFRVEELSRAIQNVLNADAVSSDVNDGESDSQQDQAE